MRVQKSTRGARLGAIGKLSGAAAGAASAAVPRARRASSRSRAARASPDMAHSLADTRGGASEATEGKVGTGGPRIVAREPQRATRAPPSPGFGALAARLE